MLWASPGACLWHAGVVRILIRFVVNALALWLATYFLSGIYVLGTQYEQITTIGVVAVVFGLVNLLIKPVARLLTTPIRWLTLGLFSLVLNGLLLLLTEYISNRLGYRFHVDGFIAAVLGALLISVASFVLELVLSPFKRRRRREPDPRYDQRYDPRYDPHYDPRYQGYQGHDPRYDQRY